MACFRNTWKALGWTQACLEAHAYVHPHTSHTHTHTHCLYVAFKGWLRTFSSMTVPLLLTAPVAPYLSHFPPPAEPLLSSTGSAHFPFACSAMSEVKVQMAPTGHSVWHNNWHGPLNRPPAPSISNCRVNGNLYANWKGKSLIFFFCCHLRTENTWSWCFYHWCTRTWMLLALVSFLDFTGSNSTLMMHASCKTLLRKIPRKSQPNLHCMQHTLMRLCLGSRRKSVTVGLISKALKVIHY